MKDKDKRHSKKKSGDASAQDVKDAAGGQDAAVSRVNGDSHRELTDHFTWTDEDDESESRSRRRVLHAQTEGKRKERMRAGIETLRKLLPPEHRNHGQRESLVCVLERAEQYILQLRDQRDRCLKQDGDTVREEEIARLRSQLEDATVLNQRYRALLRNANIPEFLAGDTDLVKHWKCKKESPDNSVNHSQALHMSNLTSPGSQSEIVTMATLSSPGSQSEAGESSGKSKKKKKNRHTVSAAIRKAEAAGQKASDKDVGLLLAQQIQPPVPGIAGTASFVMQESHAGIPPLPQPSLPVSTSSVGLSCLPPSSGTSMVISESDNSGTSAVAEGSLEPNPEDEITVIACSSGRQMVDPGHTAALDTLASVAESANNLTPSGMANNLTSHIPPPGSLLCSDSTVQATTSVTTSAPIMTSIGGMTGNGGMLGGAGMMGASAPMVNMPLLGNNNTLGGQLVYQNGQLILINDPNVPSPAALPSLQAGEITADTGSLLPTSGTAAGSSASMINTSATTCAVAGNRPTVDFTRTLGGATSMGSASMPEQQVPACTLGSTMLGMPQTVVLNNQTMMGAQPTGLGLHQAPVYAQPPGTSMLGGSGTPVNPPGSLPQALILPNGQIVPVVTQPNLLFPGCAPVNSGFIVNTNTGTTIARQTGPITAVTQSVQVAAPGAQGMLPGGLLMTTTLAGSSVTDTQGTIVNSQPQTSVGTNPQLGVAPALMGQNQIGMPALGTVSQALTMAPQWAGPRISGPVGVKPGNNLVTQPSVALPPVDNTSVQTFGTNDVLQPHGGPRMTNPVVLNGGQLASSVPAPVPRQTAPSIVADVKPSVSTSGTASAASVTATAILTPEGNIVLTLPPGTQPGSLLFDGNNMLGGMPPTTAAGTTSGAAESPGGSGQASAKKNKKGNQRALMPKPNAVPGSPAASGLQPTPALWNTPLFASTASDGAGSQSDGGNTSDGTQGSSTSPVAQPVTPLTISTESSGTITVTTASPTMSSGSQTTDILAKAAESIFSVSEVSPPISSFYNPAHDDNPLHIDTEMAEGEERPSNLATKVVAPAEKSPLKPETSSAAVLEMPKDLQKPDHSLASTVHLEPPVLTKVPQTPSKPSKSRSNRNKSGSKTGKKSNSKGKVAVKEEEMNEVAGQVPKLNISQDQEFAASTPPEGTSVYDFTESPVEEQPVSAVGLRHKSGTVDTTAIAIQPPPVVQIPTAVDGTCNGKQSSLSEWERQQHAAATKPKKKSKSKKKDKKEVDRPVSENMNGLCELPVSSLPIATSSPSTNVTTSVSPSSLQSSPAGLAPSMPLTLMSPDMSPSGKSSEEVSTVSLDPPVLSLPDFMPSGGKKQKGEKRGLVRPEDLLPEKLEFSACDLSQVLDQVESLGKSLCSSDNSTPAPKGRHRNKSKSGSRSGGDQPPNKKKKISPIEPVANLNDESTSDIIERAMREISPLDMDLGESPISTVVEQEQLDSSGKEHDRDTDTESEMHIVVSEGSGLMSPPLNQSTELPSTPNISTPPRLTFSPKLDTTGTSVSTSSATVTQPCSLPLTTSAASTTTSTTSALRPTSPMPSISLAGTLSTPHKLDLSSPLPPLSLPFSTPYKSSLASPLSSFSIPGPLSTPFKSDLASPSQNSGFSGRLSPGNVLSTPRSSSSDIMVTSNNLMTMTGSSVGHTTVTSSHTMVSTSYSHKSMSPVISGDPQPAPVSVSNVSSTAVTSQARHSNIAVLARTLGPPKAVPLVASQARATPQKNQVSSLPPTCTSPLCPEQGSVLDVAISSSQSERDRGHNIPPPITSLAPEPARLTHSPRPSLTQGINTSVLKHVPPDQPQETDSTVPTPRPQDTNTAPPSGFSWQPDSGKMGQSTAERKDSSSDSVLDPRTSHMGSKFPTSAAHVRAPSLSSEIPAQRPHPGHSGSTSHPPPAPLANPLHKPTSPATRASPPITGSSLQSFGPASQSSYSAESLFSPAESIKSQASSFEDQSPAPVPMSVDPLPRKRQLSSSSQHSSHSTATTQPDPPQLYNRHQGPPSDMFPPPPGGSSCGMDSRRRNESTRFPSPYGLPPSSSRSSSNSEFLSPPSIPSSTCPSSSSTFSFSLSSTSSTITSSGRGTSSSAPCRAPMSQSQFPFYTLPPAVSSHSHMPSRLPPHGHPSQHQSSLSVQHHAHMLREPNPAHQPRSNPQFPGFGGASMQFSEPGPMAMTGRNKEHSSSSMGPGMGPRPSPGSSMSASSQPHPRPSSVSRSPHMSGDTPYYPSSGYMEGSDSLGNVGVSSMPTPPLHHPSRHTESSRSRSSCDAPGRPASHFSTVPGFSPGSYDPPPLQLTRSAPTPSSQPEMFSSAPATLSTGSKSGSNSRSSENSRSKSMASKSKSQRSSKSTKKAKHYEADTNLANSIFESRSMTPLFPLPGMSPPPPGRQLGADGPTYLPSNLFSNPSRPLSNSTPLQHKNPADLQNPFNPLFPTGSRGQNGLGLNFQPGFGMNPVAATQHSASSQMAPHSSTMSVTPHMPNFNLSNLFSDMSGGGQGDGVQISPIKFAHGQTLLPQPGMEHNIPAHHQGAPLYHNRSHPSAMIHNPMSFNSILGHNHHGFDARPMAPPINSGMGPPFGGHSHGSFGMPPLNFPMHEH